MKVLDKQEMIKRNKVKRTLTEREILATASHPFIVTLHWSFQNQERLFFIMDYCAGGEFFRMLQKQPGKCLPEEAVRFYSAEVLLALEYLHMMGFIYRDLKPENILVDATGHIMLTDFDLSKAAAIHVDAQVIKKMLTGRASDIYATPELSTMSFVGTEEYMAPEIIANHGQTSSVDWWTFGILMYEMLFGCTPYRGKSQKETFSLITDGHLHFPDKHMHHVSSTCKTLVKKLLAHDPKKRLGSSHGAADIKKHKFFEKINFPLIRNMTPPIIPQISNPTDTSNFRNLHEKEEDEKESEFKEDPSSPFKDFTPISRPHDRGERASLSSSLSHVGL